jgi:3',5'-cyclic AMP phosphodiesterase CpdA
MPLHLLPPPTAPNAGLTRRRLLAGLAAGAAAAAVPRRLLAADPAPPPVWALLADTHINADAAKSERGFTMSQNLRAVLDDVAATVPAPAGVVIDGDVAHRSGEPGDYRTLMEILEPHRQRGLAFHLALGNHDHRENIRAAVPDPADAVEGRRISSFVAGGVHWLFLDSLDVVNRSPGRLGEAQRKWLAERLDARPETPAVIVVHHHLANDKGALIDTPELYEAIVPRVQVKAVVYGHTHRAGFRRVDGIHLVNLPAIGYVFAPDQPVGWAKAAPRPDGMDVELRCLDPKHALHGKVEKLTWR